MIHGLARGAFDAAEWLLARAPARNLSVAAALGALRNRLSQQWPSSREVHALFPGVDAARIARQIAALEARHRVLLRAHWHARNRALRTLVAADESLLAVAPPAVFVAFHIGEVHALGPALERLRASVLAFRDGRFFKPRPPLEIETTRGTNEERAAAFHRALRVLEDGGFVVLAPDVVPGPSIETKVLGRSLPLARGAFALSRISGAPIVPLVGRWMGRGISVTAGEPVAHSDSEQQLALAAATWLERHLLASPSQITLGLLRKLLSSEILLPVKEERTEGG